MEITRAYKFRLYPTEAQAERLSSWLGAVRAVYNAALEQRKTYGRSWRKDGAWVPGCDPFGRDSRFSAIRQNYELKLIRAEFDWVRDVPADALVNALRDLDRAYKNFFGGRARYANWRRIFENDSFTVPAFKQKANGKVIHPVTGKRMRMNVVFGRDKAGLPKIGRVRYKKHRKIRGHIKTVTVKREGDRWYICASSVIEIKDPAPMNDLAVGVDFGIAKTYALSTGEELPFDRTTPKMDKQIKKARRRLSRAKRGSQRRVKTKQRLVRLTQHQADRRRHALHRITTDLSRRYGMVCIEDLKIQNMTKSAKGTVEVSGKNVKAKSGLNRELLEGSPFEFRRQLGYKLEAAGGLLVAVEPAYTSQTCPVCGVIDAASRKRQNLFECTGCGHSDNADFNAATNIVNLGLATAVGRRSAGSESHWRLSPRISPVVSPHGSESIPQFSTAECRESLTSSAGCPDPGEDPPELKGDHSSLAYSRAAFTGEDPPELKGDHSQRKQ